MYQFPLFEPLKYYKEPKTFNLKNTSVYIYPRNTPIQKLAYQKCGNLANISLLIIPVYPPPPPLPPSPPVKIISSPSKLNFHPFSKNPSPVYYIYNVFQPLAFNCLVVDCHNFTSVPGSRITFKQRNFFLIVSDSNTGNSQIFSFLFLKQSHFYKKFLYTASYWKYKIVTI